MAAFREVLTGAFEDEMVEHLRRFAAHPAHCAGEQGLGELIRAALPRAQRFGLTQRGPVRLFIELSCMFGHPFDTDPQVGWARWILGSKVIPHQIARATRLHEAAVIYIERVVGLDRTYLRAAIQRLIVATEEYTILQEGGKWNCWTDKKPASEGAASPSKMSDQPARGAE